MSIELSKLTPEDILNTRQAVLLPLLALTKEGDKREQVDRMFREIQASESVDQNTKNTLELLGYTLTSLIFRKHSREDRDWLIRSFHKMHEILRETPIFQEILREGREEGREEGHLEQVRSTLLKFTNKRFPSLISLAKSCAEDTNNIQVLEDLAFKVAVAQSIEDAVNHLLRWKDTYKDLL